MAKLFRVSLLGVLDPCHRFFSAVVLRIWKGYWARARLSVLIRRARAWVGMPFGEDKLVMCPEKRPLRAELRWGESRIIW